MPKSSHRVRWDVMKSKQSTNRVTCGPLRELQTSGQNGNASALKLNLNPQTVLLGLIFYLVMNHVWPQLSLYLLSGCQCTVTPPPTPLSHTHTQWNTNKQTELRHHPPESHRIISGWWSHRQPCHITVRTCLFTFKHVASSTVNM